jgi:hypothetical protein
MKTAQQLAAAVQRELAHSDAERALADLRGRRKKLREKLFAVKGLVGTTPAERRLYVEERDIEENIRLTSHELIPMRQAHGRKVSCALASTCIAEAESGLKAIADLEAAVGRLNALQEQIRLAGGEAPSIAVVLVKPMALLLEKIVRQRRTRGMP